MKIILAIGATDAPKVLEVSPLDLLKALQSLMQRTPFKEWRHVEHGFCIPPDSSYALALLPPEERGQISDVSMVKVVPAITLKLTDYAGEWATIRWFWSVEWLGRNAPPDDTPGSGLLFFYRLSDDVDFQPVKPHCRCLVDPSLCTVTINYCGTLVEFSSDLSDWPRMVSDAEVYLARHLAEQMLEEGDANPLTILLRSPQPYRGLAEQIIAQLEVVRGALGDVEIPHDGWMS